MFTDAPRLLCVMRLSALGDVCNAIAAIQAIQKTWPTTKIIWVCGTLEAQLVRCAANIEVIEFNKKDGIKSYFKLWRQLKSYQFDALLHMQASLRASIATLGIKAKYKIGFAHDRSRELQTLFTNKKVQSPTSLHVVDNFMAFVQALGIKTLAPTWNLHYTEQDKQWATKYISDDKCYLVVVVGASKAVRNWYVQGYVDVILHAKKLGWSVILSGSPLQADLILANEIQNKSQNSCINLVGKSTIIQLLALIDHADLVLSPDTGPVHMASAVNTPVIGLYAHMNPQRVGAYNYLNYAVSVYDDVILNQTGKSTKQLSWRTRAKDPDLMQLIDSERVIKMFDLVCEENNLAVSP